MVGTGILRNNIRFSSPECYTTFWRTTIYSDALFWWDITPMLTLYWSGPYYRIWLFTLLCEVSIEHLQLVRYANRGCLLLRTPSPVPHWDLQVFLCWEPISPELVLIRTFEFRTSLGTYVLVCCWLEHSLPLYLILSSLLLLFSCAPNMANHYNLHLNSTFIQNALHIIFV